MITAAEARAIRLCSDYETRIKYWLKHIDYLVTSHAIKRDDVTIDLSDKSEIVADLIVELGKLGFKITCTGEEKYRISWEEKR